MLHDEYVEDVKRYSDMVFRIALHSCANKEDAEDILQNVFLKLLQNKKNFNSEEHKKSWLIRVTVNECHSLFKSPLRSRRQSLESITHFLAAQQEEVSDLFYAVMELPEKYRVVVNLYYYEDYSVKEIAKILKMNESSIQTRLMRARGILKKKMKGVLNYE